jgi:hypothetical protein
MSHEAQATQPTQTARSTTLGPLAYFMPLMPAVLAFGPLFLVMHTGSILAMVAAVIFGAGLCLLWACVMRIAQRLDAQDTGSVQER